MTARSHRAVLDEDTLIACREFLGSLLRDAGEAVLPWFRQPLQIDDKADAPGRFDPVTAADREAEALMRARIERHFPFGGILGEEQGASGRLDGPHWVIDPIDGTRSFVSGLLHWGMLVALNDGGRPVLGACYQPWTRELFIAGGGPPVLEVGGHATALKTRPTTRLDAATLCVTHPEMFDDPAERAAFDALERRVRLSRHGTDCYAYGVLALGQVDLVVESGMQPWDIQALIPVVEAAGGCVCGWSGEPIGHSGWRDGRVLAAATPALRDAAIEVLSSTRAAAANAEPDQETES